MTKNEAIRVQLMDAWEDVRGLMAYVKDKEVAVRRLRQSRTDNLDVAMKVDDEIQSLEDTIKLYTRTIEIESKTIIRRLGNLGILTERNTVVFERDGRLAEIDLI